MIGFLALTSSSFHSLIVVFGKPFCIIHNKSSSEVLSSGNLKLLDPSSLSSIIVLDFSQTLVNWARKPNG
jgi:hypothetical protein